MRPKRVAVLPLTRHPDGALLVLLQKKDAHTFGPIEGEGAPYRSYAESAAKLLCEQTAWALGGPRACLQRVLPAKRRVGDAHVALASVHPGEAVIVRALCDMVAGGFVDVRPLAWFRWELLATRAPGAPALAAPGDWAPLWAELPELPETSLEPVEGPSRLFRKRARKE